MSYSEAEKQIWEKQNIKEKEQEIYESSYKVNEDEEFEFLDEN